MQYIQYFKIKIKRQHFIQSESVNIMLTRDGTVFFSLPDIQ